MTKVSIVCAGYCKDNGKPTQQAGCGIALHAVDDHGREATRRFGFALGSVTANVAEVQAVSLALRCIIPVFRRGGVQVHTGSAYAIRCLDKASQQYVVNPTRNAEEIMSAREWVQHYPKLQFIQATDGLDEVKELAKDAALAQRHFDSGTQS